MELELNWERTKHYELLLDTHLSQEETQETIVPDAYPDILRIVEAGGQLCLTEKELQDGSLRATGVIDGWLLYQPEDGETLCKIEVKLPFSTRMDVPGSTSDGCCIVHPVLCSMDARTLNPRKVLVRADIGLNICVYEPGELSVCCGLECDTDIGMQQMIGEQRAYLNTAVKEKEFSVYEEVHAPAGLDKAADLLSARADVWCTEAKMIGNKLIFKGEAGIHLRYGSGGQVNAACIPISFSQIIEVEGAGEQEACRVSLYVTNLECVQAGEDGRMLNITLDLIGQAVVTDQIPMVVLQDAYSTKGELSVEVQNGSVTTLLDRYTKPQSMRELLETEVQAKSVVDAAVHICGTSVTGTTAETRIQADILYTDERDQVYHMSRTILACAQLDLPEGAQCRMSCSCPGEAFATVAAGGIEVRFNLELSGCVIRKLPVLSVKNARWTECGAEIQHNRPSVVMRAAMPGERLWDIAKAYHTTTQRICQANGIERDGMLCGRMLLIPAGC